MNKWNATLLIMLIVAVGLLVKQCNDMPVPKWKAGDRICIKHNNAEVVVFSTFRYAYGVTYYLTAFDNLNHGYELKLSEESLQDCTEQTK